MAWKCNSNQITQCRARADSSAVRRTSNSYSFDYLFGTSSTTTEIYMKSIKSVIVKGMGGYHTACVAYGQTSSGKTYTMQGTRTIPGIIPLSVEEIFSEIENTPEREFLLRCSYLELYNENIIDLLSPKSKQIRIFEDKERGVAMKGVKESIVISPQQIFSLIGTGERHRHIGATDANRKSSRSHTIFRMIVESKVKGSGSGGGRKIRVSSLSLIDLAGSESVKLTNAKGARQKEGSYINKVRRRGVTLTRYCTRCTVLTVLTALTVLTVLTVLTALTVLTVLTALTVLTVLIVLTVLTLYIHKSLLTLGHVIYKLTEVTKTGAAVEGQHIPYRDSKLTRILQVL
jgi:hypothetical protein